MQLTAGIAEVRTATERVVGRGQLGLGVAQPSGYGGDALGGDVDLGGQSRGLRPLGVGRAGGRPRHTPGEDDRGHGQACHRTE